MKIILVIEDDLGLQDTYERKLTDEGYEVIKAMTAEGALKEVTNRKPDLILLDIMLPGSLNGFDFLKEIKKDDQNSKIPVLVMTNLDTEEEQAKKLGVQGYFIKANQSIDDVIKNIKITLGS